MFKVNWGIRYICLKMACNSKTAGYIAKWSKMWDSWKLVTHVGVDMTLKRSRSIWHYLVHLSQTDLYLKRLVIERNEGKFETWGV